MEFKKGVKTLLFYSQNNNLWYQMFFLIVALETTCQDFEAIP